ncbi:MAG TPA: adenylate/guanylate cyclase domain-containing protein [Acidimicrobiia bacterium]
MTEPEVRYAKSGDVSIAYLTYGEGPMDLVYVPGFISNCDLMWELPFYRNIIRRFGTFARVITFDKRGTGLSDRTLGHGSIAERTDDIRAVMDAAGIETAALVGLSEGGPLCLTYAAAFPDRVRALVLWGTFARMLECDDYPIGLPYGPIEELINGAVREWGRGIVLRTFVSDLPDDDASVQLIARYERSSATPTLVGEVLRQNISIDVRSVLSSISAPTLVVHRQGDRVVPLPLARYVAEHIEGAQLVELPGDFHVTADPSGEADSLGVIEEFLTGTRSSVESDRMLATVMFTDIVDSTRTAAELGDRRWTELLGAHDQVVRRELARFGGREVDTTGDGFLAVFESPARAIRCAEAITAGARAFGVEVRAGLHTGECELYGSTVAGVAVHIGARVCPLAGPGEVVVTSTVRDLVMGSDIAFEDRGSHELKGVPGDWHLLAVKG